MNHSYKVIWNQATATHVAVPEFAKGRGAGVIGSRPSSSVHFFIKPLIAALICIGFTFASHAAPLTVPSVSQLPIGAQVVAGAAQVSQAGAVMTVQQTTDKAVVNWQRFDVGSQATVQFVQPSAQSVTLNRVQDSNPSQIFGQIKANGTVFLQNPNGVYFAPGSSVDVGSLLATTHSIHDADFINGDYKFNRDGAVGTIINHGLLNSKLGGYIALLAPEVRNLGVVVAKGGTMVLAAGETYRLQFEANDTLTHVLVSPATVAAYVDNGNAVMAPGGLVILSAQAANAIQGGLVNNTGSIQADGLVSDGGVVRLVASHSITHTGSITVDAAAQSSGHGGRLDIIASLDNPDSHLHVNGELSAKGGTRGGDGGQIETSGSQVRIGDATRVTTHAPQGTGGTWLIDPTDFTVGTGAGSDISGATLAANLDISSVTIMSSQGASGTSGDININETVSWTNANKLTLSAANNINILSHINVPVGGSVALVYGTSVGTGDYNFGSFSANQTQFTGAINFAGTGAGLFTTQLGANAVDSYTVITNPSTYVLATNPTGDFKSTSGKYALGQNYNFDRSFTASPITASFTGKFEGLGHTVGNLTGTGAIGLFNNSSGLIRDVGVDMNTGSANSGTGGLVNTNSGVIKNSFANASVYSASSATLGGLVGTNSGLITNSFSTGSVSGTSIVGGLIGSNGTSSSSSPSNILNSFSKASVTGTSGSSVGGLIGQNASSGSGSSSTVTNSFATGDVSMSTGVNGAGGLIGYNVASGINSSAAVINSYATGSVNGPTINSGNSYWAGGLIGRNNASGSGANASVSGSYATGNVNIAVSWLGGLIGLNEANGASSVIDISNSYTTGTVFNNPGAVVAQGTGGLVGLNRSGASNTSMQIQSSYATGSVTGNGYTGGLVGWTKAVTSSNHTISNSYATGAVSGTSDVGGLVGQNSSVTSAIANIESSYATGSVNSTTGSAGGLIGTNKADTGSASSSTNISNSYATGNVTNTAGSYVGGLVGFNLSNASANSAYISNSYATGTVSSGGDSVGGLVGNNQGYGDSRILQSYATGSVTSTSALGNNVGGLVGSNNGGGNVSISQSYATGAVSGAKTVGGLVGYISASTGTANIDQSYATSPVQQTNATGVAGGLVGHVLAPTGTGFVRISNSFATGSVTGTGTNYLGGLVGNFAAASKGEIQNTYALGTVSGSTNMGGLIGTLTVGSSLQNNYWNSSNNAGLHTVNGSVAGKSAATSGIASLSTTEMQTSSNFSGWDTNSVWQSLSYFNNQLPFLRQNNTLATITLVSGSSVYGDTPVLSYAITNSFGSAITSPIATGTPVWELFENGASVGFQSISSTTNAGAYSLSYNSGISLGNYTIMSGAPSNWTVSKASLGLSVTGTYSGSTSITPSSTTVIGLKNGETMVPTAVTISNANVATANKYVTAITANTGNANFNNYELASSFNATPDTTSTNTAVLNPITLTVTATASLTGNPYKGSAYTGTYTSSAMVLADAALISVSGVATGTDAGTYRSRMSVNLSGSAVTNYSNPIITDADLVVSPKTITITNQSLTANYDGVTSYASLASQTNYASTALVGSDTMGSITQTANKAGVAQAGGFSVTPSGASVTSGNPSNYQFSYVAANHTVNPLTITVANAAVSDKVYDRTTTAVVTSDAVLGVLAMDVNNIILTPAGSFTSAQVGSNIPVNLSYSLSGTAAANYVITQPTGLTASITPKPLDILGQQVSDKVYDTTTSAVLGQGSLSGVLLGDTVSLIQAGQFVDKNAGLNKAVLTSNSLSGADAGNYSVTQVSGLTGNISRATLGVTGLRAEDKVYDASTDAVVTGVPAITALGGDSVTVLGTATGMFSDHNVGAGKSVLLTGLSIDSAIGDGDNYALPSQTVMTASISRRDLTITGTRVISKVYDGTTTAHVTDGSLQDVQGSDVLVLSQSGSYADQHAGLAKTVTILDSITGAAKDNYNLIQPTGITGSITPAPLTATVSAANKVYDGNTMATPTLSITAGLVGTEQLSVGGTASFNAKDVATAHVVTVNTVSLADGANGGRASNYSLSAGQTTSANITPAPLTASVTAPNKTYDGNTDATPTLVITAGLLGAEQLGVSGTASFNAKDVATAHVVTVDNVSLADGDHGSLASNYSLLAGQTTVAAITPASLSAKVDAFSKVYDGNTSASPSLILAGWMGSDSHLGVQASATLNSPNVLDATQLVVDSVTLSNGNHGELANNYQLNPGQMGLASVTPAALTASVTAPDKMYDGNASASPSLSITSGLVGAQQINVSGTAHFNSKNVLTANLVTVDSVSLTDGGNGGMASNYSLTTGQTTPAFITPAPLTVSDISASSAVSGNFKPGVAALVGLIGADKVTGTVELDSPVYSAPGYLAVGDYKQAVNALAGDDAGNYTVTAFTTALANYTVAPIPVKSSVANQNMAALPIMLPANTITPKVSVAVSTSTPTSTPRTTNEAKPATSQASANAAVEVSSAAPQKSNSTPAPAVSRTSNLMQASMKSKPMLISGFAEQDLEFAADTGTNTSTNAITLPAAPDVFGNTSNTYASLQAEPDNTAVDWEDRLFAGLGKVLQSPITYQVLTGASSLVFLVKTLAPGLLPAFQVPGSLPNNTPARLPSQPASMVNGRTTLGRWLGMA